MQSIQISGELRTDIGKSANKNLRKLGKIPAVIYGDGENVYFNTTPADVKHLIYTPDFKLANIEVDGTTYRTIVKDIQFHPVSDEIMHIDFLKLTDGKPLKVELPVRFSGTSPGVKNGGIFVQSIRKVKVKTIPEHLVDELIADISKLKLGHSIRVRDLKLNEGVEILSDGAIPIASVTTPRALKTVGGIVEDEDEEGEEGDEGEEGGSEGDNE